MSANPDPARITNELWWLWEQLHALEPATQLGGIYANKAGYHNTRDNLWRTSPGDYSIKDTQDWRGPMDKAAALDWTFPDAQRGDYRTISRYCQRLDASSRDMHDLRLNVLREWYGQTDNDSQVEGWDCRYLRPVTSDRSHLWHIHLSFGREHVTDPNAMRAVLSVLRGQSWQAWLATLNAPQEDDMIHASGQVPECFGYKADGTVAAKGGTLALVVDGVRSGSLGWGNGYATIAADPGQREDCVVNLRVWWGLSDGGMTLVNGTGDVLLTKAHPLWTAEAPANTKCLYVARVNAGDAGAQYIPVGAALTVTRG